MNEEAIRKVGIFIWKFLSKPEEVKSSWTEAVRIQWKQNE